MSKFLIVSLKKKKNPRQGDRSPEGLLASERQSAQVHVALYLRPPSQLVPWVVFFFFHCGIGTPSVVVPALNIDVQLKMENPQG